MRTLFLCHRFPLPAEGGGKIRALHMLRHLVASGHEVTLGSLIRSDDEARAAEAIAALGVRLAAPRVRGWLQWLRMLSRLPTPEPATFGYFHSPALARRIARLLTEEHWDLILVHCSSMGPYVEHVRGISKIIDFADMDSQKWLDYSREKSFPVGLAYRLEGRKLERRERSLADAFDFCTTISGNELESFRALGSPTPADWFPNGVDLDYFSPAGQVYDPDLIVFVGRMDYFPNEQAMRWFCDRVWPKLRELRSTLKLRIVGANPPAAVRRLGEIEGVEVTGTVSDVRPHVARGAVSIAPLKIARGLQNKVLECMAMGVPVIASAKVANGLGLASDPSSPVRLADESEDFVQSVLAIVENPNERNRLASAGRAFVESRFGWSRAVAKLDEILELANVR